MQDLDLAGLFASIIVSCPEQRTRLSNAVTASLFSSLLAHQAGTYLRWPLHEAIASMCVPPCHEWEATPSQSYLPALTIGTVRVERLAQEHNTIFN